MNTETRPKWEFAIPPEEMTYKELQTTFLHMVSLDEEYWPLDELDRVLIELKKRQA